MSISHILFDNLPALGTAGEVLTCEGTSSIATWTNIATALSPSFPTYVAPTLFTPVLEFGSGSTGITYTVQSGVYTQIANVIEFSIFITLSNKGSSTGAARVTGLPVVANPNIAPGFTFGMLNTTNVTPGANCSLLFSRLAATSNTFALFQANEVSGSLSALNTLTNTNFSNTSTISFTGTYY